MIVTVTFFQPLLHLMIPVALVYVGEYMINQGLVLFHHFKCKLNSSDAVNSLRLSSRFRSLCQQSVPMVSSSVPTGSLPLPVLFPPLSSPAMVIVSAASFTGSRCCVDSHNILVCQHDLLSLRCHLLVRTEHWYHLRTDHFRGIARWSVLR